jgi:phosphohistidine phosphatase
LIRHGRAARGAWADADRPLTPEGEAEVERIARGLVRLEPHVPRVVSSPLVRAYETAVILAKAWGSGPVAKLPELAIGGDPVRAAARLFELGGTGSVLAVGHSPDLGALLVTLTGVPLQVRFECAGGTSVLLDGAAPEGVVLEWAMGPDELSALGA